MLPRIAPITATSPTWLLTFDLEYAHCVDAINDRYARRTVRCVMKRIAFRDDDPEPEFHVYRCDTGEFLGNDDTKADAEFRASMQLMTESREAARTPALPLPSPTATLSDTTVSHIGA